MPDFIIIGAQRAGTTSLFNYLIQHPQILAPESKETHFFDNEFQTGKHNFERGLPWYLSFFPRRKSLKNIKKTFEATPAYIFNPLVPKKIFDVLPKVKLIAILRNPTNRALSHYFLQKRKGREKLPLLDALKSEEERLEPIIRMKDFNSKAYRHFSYKSRGIYINQIERLLKYFPRKQLLIINNENLLIKRVETLKKVFDFIGIDSKINIHNSIDLEPDNVAYYKNEVPSEVYQYLNNFFCPYNEALYKLLGEDFGW